MIALCAVCSRVGTGLALWCGVARLEAALNHKETTMKTMTTIRMTVEQLHALLGSDLLVVS